MFLIPKLETPMFFAFPFGRQLLHLRPGLVSLIATLPDCYCSPGVPEIPVRKMFRQIVRICRALPVHQMQVDIVETKPFQRRVNAFLTALVPRIVELGGHPNLLPRNSGVLDALTNLVVGAISLSSVIGETKDRAGRCGNRRVDVAVSCLQCILRRNSHRVRL
jgi:hypothetical protein